MDMRWATAPCTAAQPTAATDFGDVCASQMHTTVLPYTQLLLPNCRLQLVLSELTGATGSATSCHVRWVLLDPCQHMQAHADSFQYDYASASAGTLLHVFVLHPGSKPKLVPPQATLLSPHATNMAPVPVPYLQSYSVTVKLL